MTFTSMLLNVKTFLSVKHLHASMWAQQSSLQTAVLPGLMFSRLCVSLETEFMLVLFCRNSRLLGILCFCPLSLHLLPASLFTHMFFYRSQFPDSSSYSCCSSCWCPERYERPQSELPHQSQVTEQQPNCSYSKRFCVSGIDLSVSSHRSITKTVVNSEVRKEIVENQKVW